MAEKFALIASGLQSLTANVPPIALLSVLPAEIFQCLLLVVLAVVLLILIWMLSSIFSGIRKWSIRRTVRKAFGITDLSKFTVRKMGRSKSKYYRSNGANTFEINLPHWKFTNEDGTKQNRRVNKVVWEECSLWLHNRHKVYVLTTTNPYEVIFLVHMLRDNGIDIAPCRQELDKQEKMEREKKGVEESIRDLIESAQGNEETFADFCKQRLTLRGCTLSDAPKNNYGLNFFYRKNSQPVVVKCQLVPRDYLSGIDEMKGIKAGTEELFAESCLFITTGHLSVAAAGFALTNNIEIISDERLVEIMEESKPIPADKMFTRWELTNNDLKNLLSEDLLSQIF